MSDEDRRLLEREARYNTRLAAFLTCMREGHDPAPGSGRFGGHVDLGAGIVPVRTPYCKRCRLVYVEENEIRPTGAIVARPFNDAIHADELRMEPPRCPGCFRTVQTCICSPEHTAPPKA